MPYLIVSLVFGIFVLASLAAIVSWSRQVEREAARRMHPVTRSKRVDVGDSGRWESWS